MILPDQVVIKEVGPRDGLQNEAGFVSTEDKISLVDRLSDAGLKNIEVTSFVHPKWIPQLSDAEEVLAGIKRYPGVEYSALVPNERGLERALTAGIDAVNVFMSASESHNQKNINKSLVQTYPILESVVRGAKAQGLPVRGYVSTVFGCPYEGEVPVKQVREVSERLFEMGIDELSLGDTIGVAVPSQVTKVIEELQKVVPLERIGLHFHNTRGMAVANVLAGLLAGVLVFDGSVGGLGGCPYAPGASGNVATDDLLYLFEKMGVQTGIDAGKFKNVTAWLEGILARPLASHARAVARGDEGGLRGE